MPGFEEKEGFIVLKNGHKVFTRDWIACGAKNMVMLVHGLYEHSGRWRRIVNGLSVPDTSYFAFDFRGHGLTPGRRGACEGIDELVGELRGVIEQKRAHYNYESCRLFLAAQSLGSLVALKYALKPGNGLGGLVLSAPLLGFKKNEIWLKIAANFLGFICPNLILRKGLPPEILTHDNEEIKEIRNDPLMHAKTSVKLVRSIFDSIRYCEKNAGKLNAPLLMMLAGSDLVVDNNSASEFASNVQGVRCKTMMFAGFYHDILHEKDGRRAIDETGKFIKNLKK